MFSQSTTKFNKILKPLLIIVALVVILLVLLLVTVPIIINKDTLAQRITSAITSQVGRDVRYANVELNILPSPVLIISNLTVENHPQASSSSMLKVGQIDVKLGWGAIFNKNKTASHIRIRSAQLDLERLRDGSNNWDSLFTKSMQSVPTLAIDVEDGKISHTDVLQKTTRSFPNVAMKIRVGRDLQLALKTEILNAPAIINAQCDNGILSFPTTFQSNCKAEARGIDTSFNAQGVLQYRKGEVNYRGTLKLDSTNILPWLHYVKMQKDREEAPLPLSIDSQLLLTPTQWNWRVEKLRSGEGSEGQIQLKYSNVSDTPQFDVKGGFSALDIRPLSALSEAFWQDSSRDLVGGLTSDDGKLGGVLDVTVGTLNWTDYPITQVILKGAFRNNTLRLSEIVATPNQNTKLSGQGILTITPDRIKWDSRSQMKGSNFNDLLRQLGYHDSYLESLFANPYSVKFDIISRGNTINFGNIDAKIGSLTTTGGVSYSFGDARSKASVDSNLTIANLDLQPVIAAWQQDTSVFAEPADLGMHNPYKLPWLRYLAHTIDGKLTLKNFWYGKEKGNFSAQIAMRPGYADIRSVTADFAGTDISGNFEVALDSNIPNLKGTLRLGDIKIGDAGKKLIFSDSKGIEGSIWQTEKLSFVPLMHFKSNMRFFISSLSHDYITLRNLQFAAEKLSDTLMLRNVSAGLNSKGNFTANITLAEGVSPAIVMSWGIADTSFAELFRPIYPEAFMDGQIFMSGRIELGGINFQSWIVNAKATARFQGRNIHINGADATGLTRLIKNSNSMGSLNSRFPSVAKNRATKYRLMEGQVYIKNSQLSVQNTTFRGNDAVTKVAGAVNLLPWDANIQSRMSLIKLGSRPPYLESRTTGNASKPSIRHDTTDIENFLARKLR